MRRPLISPRQHAVVDVVTVVVLALAPLVFSLEGTAAVVAYLLAAVHLAMSLVTDMPQTPAKLLPMRFHGIVEAGVGVALLFGPWALGGTFARNEQLFFSIAGLVILVIWYLSFYRRPAPTT